MIGQHLRTYMLTQTAITDITSRIYPVILPSRPTYPSITYQETDHFQEETFAEQTNLTESDYTFDAWAKEYNDADSLADAIRSVLKNHTGTTGSIIIHRSVLVAGPEQFYEDSVEAYRISQTFTFTHKAD